MTVPPLRAARPAGKPTPAGTAAIFQRVPFQCSANGPRSCWTDRPDVLGGDGCARARGVVALGVRVWAGDDAPAGVIPVLDHRGGVSGEPAGGDSRTGAHSPHIGGGQRRDRADSTKAQKRPGNFAPAAAVPVQAPCSPPRQTPPSPYVRAWTRRNPPYRHP